LRLGIALIGGFAHFIEILPCTAAFLHEQTQDRAEQGKFKQVSPGNMAVCILAGEVGIP
jgi:hypothetical protein